MRLADGREIEADLVVIGAGIQLATNFAAGSLEMEPDGSLSCDRFLRTSDACVFAAGDVCSYPPAEGEARFRTEHWSHALQ